MNTIIPFPVSATLTPEQALESARAAGLRDVLIVGYNEHGGMVFRSSRMSRADALWLAEKMRLWALDV